VLTTLSIMNNAANLTPGQDVTFITATGEPITAKVVTPATPSGQVKVKYVDFRSGSLMVKNLHQDYLS
jgi:hypothetical protein